MSVLADIYKKLFALASHTHTKSQVTDFAHTHTKSQITDFGSYAAVSHGTHVSTSSCVTSINNQKGDVTLEIPSGIFSPEEYCADSNNGTLLVTQSFASSNGQGGNVGSFELTGGSFFNYRFLKLDYKYYNHPEVHGSKVISVHFLRNAVQELSSAPAANTSNYSGFPLIADGFAGANVSFYLYGYGSNGTTIYYAFHSLKELVIRGFN